MKLRETPPTHLTYCLNVHPGETWQENLRAIQTHTLAIRNRVAPDQAFGLGLRLSHQAALSLSNPETLANARAFLREHDLYAFTINGFPYGTFHGAPVKTEVYRPDWTTRERLDYTITLAGILARLLPPETEGSISTVPLAYAGCGTRANPDWELLSRHLAEWAYSAYLLYQATGKRIHLGLEPEPDCLLETTRDVIRFFEGPLMTVARPHLAGRLNQSQQVAEAVLRSHVGVCVDTCHLAIQYENLAESLTSLAHAGIRISKVQLSAALATAPGPEARSRLREFVDPVYLHQVKGRKGQAAGDTASLRAYPDLTEALAGGGDDEEWRIHFHVPLYFEGDHILASTATSLDAGFWSVMRRGLAAHWEIETYTFNVLPPALRAGGAESSIAGEYAWVLRQMVA